MIPRQYTKNFPIGPLYLKRKLRLHKDENESERELERTTKKNRIISVPAYVEAGDELSIPFVKTVDRTKQLVSQEEAEQIQRRIDTGAQKSAIKAARLQIRVHLAVAPRAAEPAHLEAADLLEMR